MKNKNILNYGLLGALAAVTLLNACHNGTSSSTLTPTDLEMRAYGWNKVGTVELNESPLSINDFTITTGQDGTSYMIAATNAGLFEESTPNGSFTLITESPVTNPNINYNQIVALPPGTIGPDGNELLAASWNRTHISTGGYGDTTSFVYKNHSTLIVTANYTNYSQYGIHYNQFANFLMSQWFESITYQDPIKSYSGESFIKIGLNGYINPTLSPFESSGVFHDNFGSNTPTVDNSTGDIFTAGSAEIYYSHFYNIHADQPFLDYQFVWDYSQYNSLPQAITAKVLDTVYYPYDNNGNGILWVSKVNESGNHSFDYIISSTHQKNELNWLPSNITHSVTKIAPGLDTNIGGFQPYSTGLGNPTAMMVDGYGRLWVGYANGSIARFDAAGWSSVNVSRKASAVTSMKFFRNKIANDGSGSIYVTFADGDVYMTNTPKFNLPKDCFMPSFANLITTCDTGKTVPLSYNGSVYNYPKFNPESPISN